MPRRRGPLLRAALPLLLLTGLAGLTACGTSGASPVADTGSASSDGSGLNGTEVGDVIKRPALALTDTSGKPFALQQRPKGELTVLYFGYTRCPDLCPTTMADLAAARRIMPAADRDKMEVVFVTEDPATDSAPVMRKWLDAFDRSFIGLTGGDPATEAALTELKSPTTKILPTAPEGVTPPTSGTTVVHTNTVYAFKDDRVVAYTDRTSPQDYSADFQALLGG